MSEFKERNFKCSIDLLYAAQKQLQFLQTVDFYPLLKDENSDIIKGAIIRYEKFWLPLVATNENQNIVPPLDVEWIWHCHLLSPYSYREDCLNLFGKVLHHRVVVPGENKESLKNSKKIWKAAYPHELFDVELNVNEIHCCTVGFKSRISYDLTAAVSRQKKFYYQVALPHYRDDRFLEEAIRRYKMFLYLKQIHPEVFLVPFYDIDLIWHSHQAHPIEYYNDTSKILEGRMLNHDDTTTDRSLGSMLYNSDLETRNLWQRAFGNEIAIYGTMFRGDPPENKLHLLNRENLLRFCNTKTTIKLTNVSFDFDRPESFPQGGMFKVQISTTPRPQEKDDVMAEGPRPNWNKSQLYFQTIGFNTSIHEQLVFQFFHSKQRFLKRSNLFLGSLTYNFADRRLHPQHMQEYTDKTTREFMFLQQLDDCKNGYDHVIVSGEMTSPEVDSCFLKLIPSTFASANMPPNLESLWGPVPMSRLPEHEDNICDVAEHKLVTLDGDTKFTCRVIHSVKLLTSVVHVFFDDKMTSVAHLIGTNQLPIRNKSSICLNPSKRERAVLIKNHAGDWGIVIGRWTGFKKGIPSLGRGKPAVQGCPGFLDVTFRKLSQTGQSPPYEHLSMKGLLERQEVFKLQNVRVNIKLGHILVKGGQEVAENICLAFVLSLLHVLCVPRPAEWRPGQTLDTESSFRGTKPITNVPSSDMAFFMAAGLLVTSPCNHFIWHTYGNNACAGCSGGDIGQVDHDLTEHGYEDYGDVINAGDGGGGCGGCGAGCGTDGGGCGSSCGGDCGGGCGGGCGGD